MALRILFAHSGASLDADPYAFQTLDDLKSWIAPKTGIDLDHQILMTAKGKQVRIQNLPVEGEIFLYDRRLLVSDPENPKPVLAAPADSVPGAPEAPPPLPPKDATLQTWQIAFRQRRDWTSKIANLSFRAAAEINKIEHQRDVIRRGKAIAISNVKQHTTNLKPKLEQTQKWADQILEDQHYLLENWQGSTVYYGALPAIAKLGQCVKTGTVYDGDDNATLADFVDLVKLKHAAKKGQEQHSSFSNEFARLVTSFDDIEAKTKPVLEKDEDSSDVSENDVFSRLGPLMEEIEVLTKKMDADHVTIQNLPDAPKSLNQAVKTAHLHENTFITSLTQTSGEINDLLTQIIELRLKDSATALKHLQEISVIESHISTLHKSLASIDIDEDTSGTFKILNGAVRLPFIYGSLLIECIKRTEWTEKMTNDSSAIAEEMATYRTDESKRRQRWAKDISAAVEISSLNAMTLGIEVNLRSQQEGWPLVTRNDLDEFLSALEKVGLADVVGDLKDLAKTLDLAPKPHSRRRKAFKNGSLHEATLGRTSLLFPGDNETLKAVQKEKMRADERLKSAESRIRKLEDLLHRQSQSSRPVSMAGLGISNDPPFDRSSTSPVNNFGSAMSKVHEVDTPTSRRFSFNQDVESKTLAQRVVSLEAELMAKRQQSSEQSNIHEMLKQQIRDAMSTKEDLLSNFEAQQQEFDDERRLLKDDNKKTKVRMEELEDELDRVYANNEHEYKIQTLEENLDNAKREALGAHEQVEAQRKDSLAERNKSERLEKNLQTVKEENKRLQLSVDEHLRTLNQRDRTDTHYQSVLLSALLRISQDADAPDDLGKLVQSLGLAVENSMSNQQNLERAIQSMQSDRKVMLTTQGEEVHAMREELSKREAEAASLRHELHGQSSQLSAVQKQLESSNQERDTLEGRFDAGETEIAILKSRIEERDRSNDTLQTKAANMEADVSELLNSLEEKGSELASLQGSYVRLDSARTAQAKRADDLSMSLFTHVRKQQRLLEQLNFSVTKQNGSMVIQRTSRSASASTTLNDVAASMKRSASGQILTMEDVESTIDPNILHWSAAEKDEDAARFFENFMETLSDFQIDVFNDAIYKRMKEVEHIARKGQRDARAYRDKAHRAQSEAHERLALRGFKEGDLALFLPTKDQATKPWAAFNVGAPHYFLREQDSYKLHKRDWMIARISKVEERIVDLSKSINGAKSGLLGDGISLDDENPYELSDGLRWYLLDAAEEKPGAPINVGLGKTTVAAVNVDAKGTVRIKKSLDGNGATRTLTRSLDSRRSSSNSKKGLVAIPSSSSPNAIAVEAGQAENRNPDDGINTFHDAEATSAEQGRDITSPHGQSEDTQQQQQASSPSKSSRTINEPKPLKPLPEKRKTKAWDSLWSLDLDLQGGAGGTGN